MNYYLTDKAKADGYIPDAIEVTHIGDDYAKVNVKWQNGEIFEFEVQVSLAAALANYEGKISGPR